MPLVIATGASGPAFGDLPVMAIATARVPGAAVLEFVLDFPEPFAPVLDCPLDSSNLLFHAGNVLAYALSFDALVLGVGRAHPLLFFGWFQHGPIGGLDGNPDKSFPESADGQNPVGNEIIDTAL